MTVKTLAIALAIVLGLGPNWAVAQEAQVQFAPQDGTVIGQGLRVGEPFAYSLCLGQAVNIPAPGGSAHLSSAQSPCGGELNPSANVQGGNPPYHFVLDSGSGFPPIGVSLDANGVLRGTPRGNLLSRFRVCAVDASANQSCQEIALQPQPANAPANQGQQAAGGAGATARRHGAGGPLLLGAILLSAGGVALGASALKTASDTGGETTSYYYANYTCGTSQGCAAAMGHAYGTTGPFCSKTSCDAWGQRYIPAGYNCSTQAIYPIYNGPASGCSP